MPASETDSELQLAEVATVGWDNRTNSPIVLVRGIEGGQVVPIWIGIAEAQAIAAALHGVEFPRPMTHDLMAGLISRLGATLEEVLIHDLREGTYYGLLKLRVGDSADPLLVDTRPSDGLALALRTGARIRVAKKILDDSPDIDFMAPEARDQVVRVLGLTLVAPTEELRQEFELPDRPGLVVLAAGGEAEAQGLRRGDLLVEINGEVPEEPLDFLEAVRRTSPGEPIRVTYWRAGELSSTELFPSRRDRGEGRRARVA